MQPLHTHERATLFLLLRGRNRERTPDVSHAQKALTFAYHPTAVPHSDEIAREGMVGLKLESAPSFLEGIGVTTSTLRGQPGR